jgi:hypothetical protein
MPMMAVDDMALTVASLIAVTIDFPDNLLWILLVEGQIRIKARVNENPVLINVHDW